MPIIIIDGPEKAGKTTLLKAIREAWETSGPFKTCVLREWSGPANDQYDTRSLRALAEDAQNSSEYHLALWSRSWACERVYGQLLQRKSSVFVDQPWLAEWYYGRAVDTLGFKVMLLPVDSSVTHKLRDLSDHPVQSRVESIAFKQYASDFGWGVLRNDYSQECLEGNTAALLELALEHAALRLPTPPAYAGPKNPRVIVVGEGRLKRQASAAWLPFTNLREVKAIEDTLGAQAFKLGWATAHTLSPHFLREAEVLVACGPAAEQWCVSHVAHRNILTCPDLASGGARKFSETIKEALHARITT